MPIAPSGNSGNAASPTGFCAPKHVPRRSVALRRSRRLGWRSGASAGDSMKPSAVAVLHPTRTIPSFAFLRCAPKRPTSACSARPSVYFSTTIKVAPSTHSPPASAFATCSNFIARAARPRRSASTSCCCLPVGFKSASASCWVGARAVAELSCRIRWNSLAQRAMPADKESNRTLSHSPQIESTAPWRPWSRRSLLTGRCQHLDDDPPSQLVARPVSCPICDCGDGDLARSAPESNLPPRCRGRQYSSYHLVVPR